MRVGGGVEGVVKPNVPLTLNHGLVIRIKGYFVCMPDRKMLVDRPSCKSVHIWCEGPNKQRRSPRQLRKSHFGEGLLGDSEHPKVAKKSSK